MSCVMGGGGKELMRLQWPIRTTGDCEGGIVGRRKGEYWVI